MNKDNLIKYYNKFNEDKRLTRRHGIVEFKIAMKYITEYLKEMNNPKIIDIGAGTGKYSIELFNMGYDVTAVELVKHNLRLIEKKCNSIKSYEGNATDLKMLKDKSFDVVILFGPLYHLISKDEKLKALNEAKRILKDDGIIFISYLMNEYAILTYGFKEGNILECINNNKLDSSYHIVSNDDDLYSYVRLEDIDELNILSNLKRIKIVSQDGPTDYMRPIINKLSEEEFDEYINYHLSICERHELLGASSHILDIVKK